MITTDQKRRAIETLMPLAKRDLTKVFCATGEGGGVDPTCGKDDVGKASNVPLHLKEPWQITSDEFESGAAYRVLKDDEKVDGRTVMKGPIPNQASIEASIDDPIELAGIREIPMEAFTLDEASLATDKRTKDLAEAIRKSGEIAPLIVAVDSKGPYILEGGHRYSALKILGAKSFPAMVVIEGGAHAEAVKRAILAGKKVPKEVIADYKIPQHIQDQYPASFE